MRVSPLDSVYHDRRRLTRISRYNRRSDEDSSEHLDHRPPSVACADACRIGLQGGSREAGYHAHEPDPNGRLWWPRPTFAVGCDAAVCKSARNRGSQGRPSRACDNGPDGTTRSVSDVVGARVEKEYGLERSRLILNSSHTHAGPIVGSEGRLASELRDEQKRVVMEYRNALVEQLVTVAGAALRDLTDVEVTFGTGEAMFAVNRRLKGPQGVQIGVNPQGPTDPQVPVIRVSRPDGSVLAVVFGYACHNTTLVSDNLAISGDYAGKAQMEIEKQLQDSTAMFFMLCGGDQNPNPRGRPEFVEEHGGALAAEVLELQKVSWSGSQVRSPRRITCAILR